MKNAKLIGGVLIAAGTGAVIYFGFVKKFEGGLTGWDKLMGKKPEAAKPVEETEMKPVAKVSKPKVKKPEVVVLPSGVYSKYPDTIVYGYNWFTKKPDYTLKRTVPKDYFLGKVEKDAGLEYLTKMDNNNYNVVLKANAYVK